MEQIIIKGIGEMVGDALAKVPAISPEEALPLIDTEKYCFVDLREGREQMRTGRIPGAIVSSRGLIEFHIDPESPLHITDFNRDKAFIFYCASGGRSALAAQVAIEMGLNPVANLTGGLAAWIKAGGPLEALADE